MKKIVMVICGIAVVCWGVASLQSGALKADNLLQESSVIETTVPESSTVLPVEPESVPKASEPITETPAPASEVSAVPETPVEQQPAESAPIDTIPEMPTQSSTVEPPKSDSSTSESSTSSGTSSESSTSQSSTSQTDTTSSSTTTPSESSTSSSSVPSGSTSSTTSSSTGTTSSSSTIPSSSGQEQPHPSTPSTPRPVPSPAPTPPAPSEPKVQTNTDAIQQPPAAFSETSTLQLPSELKTSEVAQSDLKGYELPLLSSFENKAQAALIYDGIKKLGMEQAKDFNVEQLAAKLYSDLFAIEITGTPEQASEEISVGSLLYQKKNDQLELVGVYIGKEYYLTVEDVEIAASDESTETATDGVTELDTEKAENEESDKKEKQRQVVLQPISIDEDLLVQALPTVDKQSWLNILLLLILLKMKERRILFQPSRRMHVSWDKNMMSLHQ